jgi:lipid II:glycine glycyltransferase (peptidoglycan interpeptide bridge formation enzyme)
LYALFRLGAVRTRCDLSSAIDLLNRRAPASRRTRSLKKAEQRGVEIAEGPQYLADLWPVIEENLERKLGQRPVHTAAELKELHSRFPQNIRFIVGALKGKVIAGVVLFISHAVTRAQYIAAAEEGYDVCALDLVFAHAIALAATSGQRFFDFGTSNTGDGWLLSSNIYQFKTGFGGGGVAYETYDLSLS